MCWMLYRQISLHRDNKIVLYCIVLQVPQFPHFRPQGEVVSPLSHHLALRSPETELPRDESRGWAPSKSLPESRSPKKRKLDAAEDALQLYGLCRERAILRSNDDPHDVPDDLDEADRVPEPFRHWVGVSQRLQRPLSVLPGAVRPSSWRKGAPFPRPPGPERARRTQAERGGRRAPSGLRCLWQRPIRPRRGSGRLRRLVDSSPDPRWVRGRVLPEGSGDGVLRGSSGERILRGNSRERVLRGSSGEQVLRGSSGGRVLRGEFQRTSPSQESQRTSPSREFQRSPSQESQRTSPSREFQRTSSSQEFQASIQSSPRRRQSSGSRRSKRSKSPRRRKCLGYSTTSANDSAPGTCPCTGSSTGIPIFSSGGELSSAVPGAAASQVSVSSNISASLSTSGVIVPFQGRRLPACSSPLTSPLLTPLSRLKESVFPPKLNPCLSEPAPAGRLKVSPVSSGSVGLLKSASSRLFRPLVAMKDYLFHSGSESQATGPNSTCSPTSCPCADLSSDASAARLASSGRVSSRTRAAVSSKRSPSASPKASRSRSLQRQATLPATEASASRTYLAATASRTSSRQVSPHGSSHHSSWVRETSATTTTTAAAHASTSATSTLKVPRTTVRQASSGSSHHSLSAEGSATNRSQVCSCKSSAVNVKRSRTHARHASSGSSFHARSSSHREVSRVVSGSPSRQGSAWSTYHTKCVPDQPFPSKSSSSKAPSRQPSAGVVHAVVFLPLQDDFQVSVRPLSSVTLRPSDESGEPGRIA